MWETVYRVLRERYPELTMMQTDLMLDDLKAHYPNCGDRDIVVIGLSGRVKYGETVLQLDSFPLRQFTDVPELTPLYVGYLPGAFYIASRRIRLCQTV